METALQPMQKSLPPEALAWATDKAKAPKLLEPLVTSLLDDVVIFSELEQALECKKREPDLAMATLGGEYISRQGIVFTRSSEVRAASLLERKAQIADLAKEEAALAKEHDSVSVRRDEAKTALETVSRLQRELSEPARKIEILQSEKTALERQIAAADERIAHVERDLQSVRDQFANQKTELGAFEAAQKQTVLREEELTEKTNELRLGIATDRQRHENLIAQREPLSARDAELAELITVRKADIAMYKRKLTTQADESRESEKLIQTQTAQRAEAQANSAKIAGHRATRLAAVSGRESELRHVRDSLGELQDRRGQGQVRESQFQMKIDNLLAHISRSYQVDLRAFIRDETSFGKTLKAQVKRNEKVEGGPPATPGSPELASPDLEKLITDLRTQLDNMGPVNLEAVQEYRRTRRALQIPRNAKHRSYEFPARAARRNRANQFHDEEIICRDV